MNGRTGTSRSNFGKLKVREKVTGSTEDSRNKLRRSQLLKEEVNVPKYDYLNPVFTEEVSGSHASISAIKRCKDGIEDSLLLVSPRVKRGYIRNREKEEPELRASSHGLAQER